MCQSKEHGGRRCASSKSRASGGNRVSRAASAVKTRDVITSLGPEVVERTGIDRPDVVRAIAAEAGEKAATGKSVPDPGSLKTKSFIRDAMRANGAKYSDPDERQVYSDVADEVGWHVGRQRVADEGLAKVVSHDPTATVDAGKAQEVLFDIAADYNLDTSVDPDEDGALRGRSAALESVHLAMTSSNGRNRRQIAAQIEQEPIPGHLTPAGRVQYLRSRSEIAAEVLGTATRAGASDYKAGWKPGKNPPLPGGKTLAGRDAVIAAESGGRLAVGTPARAIYSPDDGKTYIALDGEVATDEVTGEKVVRSVRTGESVPIYGKTFNNLTPPNLARVDLLD